MTLKDDKLLGLFNDIELAIQHYHYDTFELNWEQLDERMLISFQANVQGDIDTIVTPFEPTGAAIIFKRVPDKRMRERAFLEPFVGVYVFMESELVVTLKGEDTLNLSLPGQPDYELEGYKGTEFLARTVPGVSIEFLRDASNAVTGASVTLAEGVFHASKRA